MKDKSNDPNKILLSEYFLRLLEFYGITFDYTRYTIKID